LQEACNEGRPIIDEVTIKNIFSDIEAILKYNELLLEELESRFPTWSPTELISDIFLSYMDYLKIYSSYVRSFLLSRHDFDFDDGTIIIISPPIILGYDVRI
jgi:hypothetical protein